MTTLTHCVEIRLEGASLEGILSLPPDARSLVLFAHGSGSSRHSPRNGFVARALNRAGFATLLFDLLTPLEDSRGPDDPRFDIDLMADRLVGVTDWVATAPETRGLRLGYFGASTGAAAALEAAARRPKGIGAVVSRGGRPDLARDYLSLVEAPTLFLVGGQDSEVLDLNRWAKAMLRHCDLVVVPGATHLFEEPGALQQVANHAAQWFTKHLPAAPMRRVPSVARAEAYHAHAAS
jgi:putative phosphoribosyl transferase